MKATSLRAKLTLWYSVLFAVTVLAFALAAQALRSRALLMQFDNELRDELRWADILLSTIKVQALLTEGEVKSAAQPNSRRHRPAFHAQPFDTSAGDSRPERADHLSLGVAR
jgi:hypothetical protein